jgi:septum formation protein
MAEAAPRLVLASGSSSRRRMLEAAGVGFEVMPARVDEVAIAGAMATEQADLPQPLGLARAVARRLAREKALEVSARAPDALVIGGDQTLALLVRENGHEIGRNLDKPDGLARAREQLLEMRGKTHVLCSAVALVRAGAVLWEGEDSARLTMRAFSDEFVDAYLDLAGEAVCTSVGAYQLEGLGVQLFDRIEGDYFTILGMPLLPLLAALRGQGAIGT